MHIFTARVRSLREGNVFFCVCLSTGGSFPRDSARGTSPPPVRPVQTCSLGEIFLSICWSERSSCLNLKREMISQEYGTNYCFYTGENLEFLKHLTGLSWIVQQILN